MTDLDRHSQHVRELLAELHGALSDEQTLDVSLESPLREALDEVREALDRVHGDEASDAESPLARRVEELAVQFEASHPVLAGLINRLTNQLASLGI